MKKANRRLLLPPTQGLPQTNEGEIVFRCEAEVPEGDLLGVGKVTEGIYRPKQGEGGRSSSTVEGHC